MRAWFTRLAIFGLVLCLAIAGYADTPPGIEYKKWEALSDKNLSEYGRAALSMNKGGWVSAESQNFIFHAYNQRDIQKSYLDAEKHYSLLTHRYGMNPAYGGGKTHIFIFGSENDWLAFIKKSGIKADPEGFIYDKDVYVYPHGLSIRKTVDLTHEISHVLLYRSLDGPCPLWLNEGFADFSSSRTLSRKYGWHETEFRVLHRIPAQRFIPMKELLGAETYPEDMWTFYRQSELVIRFLLFKTGKYNPKKFFSFMKKMSQGSDFASSLFDIYGLGYDEFEKKFKDYAIKK